MAVCDAVFILNCINPSGVRPTSKEPRKSLAIVSYGVTGVSAGSVATNVVSFTRRVTGIGRLVFFACAFSISEAWSVSRRTASPTLTRMTRCVPPFRSRPRLIGSGFLLVGTTAALKPTSTARIKTIFHQRLRFKIVPPERALFGRFSRNDAGDRRPRHLHLHVFGDL